MQGQRAHRARPTAWLCLSQPVLLISFVIILASPVSALNPDHQISQYAHRSWRIEDGHFGNVTRAMAQTSDGYLWIGSYSGLFWFDGISFLPWTDPDGDRMINSGVTSLLGAKDGSLWVGTQEGLLHWDHHRLTRYLEGQGLAYGITESRDGTIWFSHYLWNDDSALLCRIRNSTPNATGARMVSRGQARSKEARWLKIRQATCGLG